MAIQPIEKFPNSTLLPAGGVFVLKPPDRGIIESLDHLHSILVVVT